MTKVQARDLVKSTDFVNTEFAAILKMLCKGGRIRILLQRYLLKCFLMPSPFDMVFVMGLRLLKMLQPSHSNSSKNFFPPSVLQVELLELFPGQLKNEAHTVSSSALLHSLCMTSVSPQLLLRGLSTHQLLLLSSKDAASIS